jgi:ABC-type bacteriocin/lantibiotic exporter with double-glycine peptidase domain
MYNPSAGCVTLDSHDINTYGLELFNCNDGYLGRLNMRWLHEQVSVVEQTSTLFAGTIFENIAMGKEGATQREVIEAAIMVCCYLFILFS